MEDIYVNLFWKCVCYTPSSLVTYYVMAKMLNISKRWRFMIGVTLLHILLTIATAVSLDHGLPGADTMRVILQSAIYLGAALLFSREPISRRLMAFGLCYLGTLFGEVGSIIVYSLLGGSVQAHGIADAMDHLSFYFFMQAVCFAMLVVFLLVSLRIWERVILKSHRRVLWYFSLFPASQVVLISIAAYFATIDDFQVLRYYLLGGAVLFCVAADNFLFRAIGAFSERALSEERAGWFEHLLDQQQAGRGAHPARHPQPAADRLRPRSQRRHGGRHHAAGRNQRRAGSESELLRKPRGKRAAERQSRALCRGGDSAAVQLRGAAISPDPRRGALQPVFQHPGQRLPRLQKRRLRASRRLNLLRRAERHADRPLQQQL